MTPLRAFSSILCVLLASVVGLVLSPIHPGWAVRLTRYVSRRMVGGRGSRGLTGRRTSHKPVHGKRSPASKGVNHGQSPLVISVPDAHNECQNSMWPVACEVDQDDQRGNVQAMYTCSQELGQDPQAEVQSALTNLGMPRPIARRLAKQAVRGRDFDSALRWAIQAGRVAA